MRSFIAFFTAFACTLPFAVATTTPGETSLNVMSYNIRYDNPGDGVNRWENRKQHVVDLVNSKSPDILGMQEALHNQVLDLETMLQGYAWYGVGRDDGKTNGEYSPIFFKKEKFQLLDSGTFWLSESPDVPGSKNWDAAITSIVTWAQLKTIGNGKVFFVFNTHLDHKGEQARLESVRLLHRKMQVIAGRSPIVVTGDFNCRPGSAPYRELTGGENWWLYDTFEKAQFRGNENFTGYGFDGKNKNPGRIDYIFTTTDFEVSRFDILTTKYTEYYPSDHLPVYAEVSLKEKE